MNIQCIRLKRILLWVVPFSLLILNTVIGGMALEFYKKVADYYNKPLYYWQGGCA